MSNYEQQSYPVFDMFHQWALVTAGDIGHFNSCTVGWGSLGTLWAKPGKTGSIVTIYLHPSRYTRDFVAENETFTVSFFPVKYKRALGYMGTHSGRDGDKAAAAGLTPVSMGNSVTYEEANLVFLCKKVYQHQLVKENIAQEIQEYYQSDLLANPLDENGEWQPHWIFIGEILEVRDTRTGEEPSAEDLAAGDVRDMFAGIDFSAPENMPDIPK